MNTLGLTQGKFALVDDEDFKYLNQWKWFAVKCDNKFYAARNQWVGVINNKKVSKRVYMHREILKAKQGVEVDHEDGDGLNNMKRNLRECTRGQNAANRGKQANNKSGFKGVVLLKDQPRNKKYLAIIRVNQKNISLGVYVTPQEAALKYNEAAREHFGEFANFNQI